MAKSGLDRMAAMINGSLDQIEGEGTASPSPTQIESGPALEDVPTPASGRRGSKVQINKQLSAKVSDEALISLSDFTLELRRRGMGSAKVYKVVDTLLRALEESSFRAQVLERYRHDWEGES